MLKGLGMKSPRGKKSADQPECTVGAHRVEHQDSMHSVLICPSTNRLQDLCAVSLRNNCVFAQILLQRRLFEMATAGERHRQTKRLLRSDRELKSVVLFPPAFLLPSPQNQGGDNEMKELDSVDLAVFVSVSDTMRKQS